MIPIKIISKKGHSALVEWLDVNPKRGIVPISTIQNNTISYDNLLMAIPYGVKWSEFLNLKITAEKIETELYKLGIWTADDAIQNPQRVLNALMTVYQLQLSNILQIARSVKNG